jgi:hypothetical protein
MPDTIGDGAVATDSSRRAAGDQVYVVTYFNGVTEEAMGLDAARRLLIDPASRVAEAQGEIQGGTYRPKTVD